MPEIAEDDDRRIYPRVEIDRDVQARLQEDIVEGAIGDVSAGGIALRTDTQLEIGQEISLEIEGMSLVTGRVSRALDDGFVVQLALEPDEQDRFLAEVMQIQNGIGNDENA